MSGNLIVDKVAKTAVATKTDLVRGLAKAWANINQVGVQSVRSSLNVSSIVDAEVGGTEVNMSTAQASMGYVVNIASSVGHPINSNWFGLTSLSKFSLVSADNGVSTDRNDLTFAAQGDLA